MFFFNFIAWDNLRINVYGFIGLAKYFFESHPDYFLSPLRISGSAVESLFGQYKYMSGSKLDADPSFWPNKLFTIVVNFIEMNS